jgi:hypothetical protein
MTILGVSLVSFDILSSPLLFFVVAHLSSPFDIYFTSSTAKAAYLKNNIYQ